MFSFGRSRVYGSSEALAIHAEYPPIDLHADTLFWSRVLGYDLGRRHQSVLPKKVFMGHVDLPRLRDVKAGAQIFGLIAPPILGGSYRSVSRQIDELDRYCRTRPD